MRHVDRDFIRCVKYVSKAVGVIGILIGTYTIYSGGMSFCAIYSIFAGFMFLP